MTTTRTELRKADAARLAEGVAVELTNTTGDAWTVIDSRPEFQGVHLVRGTDGARIFLRPSGIYAERGRMVAATDEPADVDQHNRTAHSDNRTHVDEQRATFAPDRPARAVAREIARRLLPGLAEETARVRAEVAKHTSRQALTESSAAQLATAGRGSVPAEQYPGARSDVSVWLPNGRAEVSGDRVRFDRLSSVSLDKACRIAAILAEK